MKPLKRLFSLFLGGLMLLAVTQKASASIEMFIFNDGSTITRFQREDLPEMIDWYDTLIKNTEEKEIKESDSKDNKHKLPLYAVSTLPILTGLVLGENAIEKLYKKFIESNSKKPKFKNKETYSSSKKELVKLGTSFLCIAVGSSLFYLINSHYERKKHWRDDGIKNGGSLDKTAFKLLKNEYEFVNHILKYGRADISAECELYPNLKNFFYNSAITREYLQSKSDYYILESNFKTSTCYLNKGYHFDDGDYNFDKLLNKNIDKLKYMGLNLIKKLKGDLNEI